MASRIARLPFGGNVATVEVACYLEGLAHAWGALEILQKLDDKLWFEKEIGRCLQFLYEIQMSKLSTAHGGFVHSLDRNEARLDVAGHVFNALALLA